MQLESHRATALDCLRCGLARCMGFSWNMLCRLMTRCKVGAHAAKERLKPRHEDHVIKQGGFWTWHAAQLLFLASTKVLCQAQARLPWPGEQAKLRSRSLAACIYIYRSMQARMCMDIHQCTWNTQALDLPRQHALTEASHDQSS